MLVGDFALDGTPVSELKPCSEKKVKLQCDDCGIHTTTTYANFRRAQARNNNNGLTRCRSCAAKITGKARRGKPAWNKGMIFEHLRGEKSPTWKGGEYQSSDGYTMIKHTCCRGWKAYKKRHIVVVEEQIGRPLEKGEIVHHIDGNKSNDDLENLWLTSHRDHRNAHQSLQEIGYQLVRSGLVWFNKETGEYVAHDKLRELLEHLEEGNQQPS